MKNFKLLFILVAILLGTGTAYACDEASTSINTITDNMDGTYDVTYDICVEYFGLEGSPSSWSIHYNNPNTTVITGFSPASITSLSGDIYNGTIRDGNCDAEEDNVYGACDGVNNVLQYYTTEAFPGNGTTVNLCFSVTTTIQGYPMSVDIIVNGGETVFATCTQTLNFPPLPACNISAITAGPQTACSNGTYSQDVIVTYVDPPTSGTLVVNGQSFPIGMSPQTVTLSGLTADSNPVNVSAQFSGELTCNFTANNVFTAPAPCGGCIGSPGFIQN